MKLTLSYAGFLLVAGFLMFVAAWLAGQPERSFDVLLRFVPDGLIEAVGALIPGNRAYLLRAFAPAATIALVCLLVFGLVGGWFLAGRMLAPLTRITDATRAAKGGSLSHRIHLPGRKDELRELADAFDAMLERVDAHVVEQRRFAANASHELRTPLATMQAVLDVARNDPNRNTGELIERLHALNTRAINLTEALLVLTRAEQRSFARERVDLSLLVEEAVETLLPLAEKRGLRIESSGGTASTTGSHALLLQVTTNLAHNAIVHNVSEGGSVWIATGLRDGVAALTVENTGEPVAPELVATLVEPFRRGTERVRSDHAGVGLGLALVEGIVRAHDGTLSLAARPDGGLRVTVELAAADVATPRE